MFRTSWQSSPCPEWCVIDHDEADHPDDRAHRDAGIAIPAVFRHRDFHEGRLVERIHEGSLTLGRWQRDGEDRVWYFIGDDAGLEIEISAESFARVTDEMVRLREGDP